MWRTERGTELTVIGEDIHATRIVLRGGRHVARTADGREALRFSDEAAVERLLPIPEAAFDGADGSRVKQVKAAILAATGTARDDAAAGLAYLSALALRQEAAGADYLDLNVDEVTADPGGQRAAMAWLVGVVETVAGVPVALDSSSAATIAAGLAASTRPHGAPLLNSASLERPEVLELAASNDCPVVLSAAGAGGMPSGVDERVANGRRIVEGALGAGLALDRLHLDALVLPVGVDPEVGGHYLEAVRALRDAFGPSLHLTGGFSNVSFGLPGRRLLNDVFLALAVDAGADSGIIDPVASDPARVFGMDRDSRAWQLAADLLEGRDPYGLAYLAAFRAGELEPSPA